MRCAIGLLVFSLVPAVFAVNPSPELIGSLTKNLSITPKQASGGAGALFGLAKSKLSATDFSKIAAVVPGIDSMIKSAPPASKSSSLGSLSSLESALPGGLGGLASVAGSFQKLGLSPQMVAQFVPLITKFVEAKGGSGLAGLLAGVLK